LKGNPFIHLRIITPCLLVTQSQIDTQKTQYFMTKVIVWNKASKISALAAAAAAPFP
jgi:hypothetical protein